MINNAHNKERNWKDGETVANFLYYNEHGRIIGEVGRVGNVVNTKHYASVYSNTTNESNSLGTYISTDYAKKAVEHFWNIQDRTMITNENDY
jgi:hypothetical protein